MCFFLKNLGEKNIPNFCRLTFGIFFIVGVFQATAFCHHLVNQLRWTFLTIEVSACFWRRIIPWEEFTLFFSGGKSSSFWRTHMLIISTFDLFCLQVDCLGKCERCHHWDGEGGANSCDNAVAYPPWKVAYPLKIDCWKMIHKMVPNFREHSLIFWEHFPCLQNET